MTLCDSCQKLSDGWLDYRITPTLKIASGASRDDTPAGVKDARAARHEQWRNTVQQQQDLIRRMCAYKHKGPFTVRPPESEKGVDTVRPLESQEATQ